MKVLRLQAWSLLSLLLLPYLVYGDDTKQHWKTDSQSGDFNVAVYPQQGRYVIGDYHHWVISLHHANGDAVDNAWMNLSGGMPDHGHGLPSQPKVTRYLGHGKYLVEGMLFNMPGRWLLDLSFIVKQQQDRAFFDIRVDYS